MVVIKGNVFPCVGSVFPVHMRYLLDLAWGYFGGLRSQFIQHKKQSHSFCLDLLLFKQGFCVAFIGLGFMLFQLPGAISLHVNCFVF